MDITALFKASVKTVRLRNKSLPAPDKNRILKKTSRDEFTIKTKDICHQITQLKALLIENRSAYMRFGCHLKSSAQMSDEDRDTIDRESENIISICTQFIGDLKAEARLQANVTKQAGEHRDGILELLSVYLKAVFNVYNEQKAYRIQHELDTYKLLKLESNKKLIPIIPAKERVKADFWRSAEDLDGADIGTKQTSSNTQQHDEDRSDMISDKKAMMTAIDEDMASKFALEQDELSAEDIQMFESENVQLYNELKGLSDEVEQIGKNVVDIAKLQEIFTEKVNYMVQYLNGFILIYLSSIGNTATQRHRTYCKYRCWCYRKC